ncbi:MAG: hypothetical protein KAT07_01215 [Calditrichia bacterium]|nr:hypothetical protein [Calditrichia bacterium]
MKKWYMTVGALSFCPYGTMNIGGTFLQAINDLAKFRLSLAGQFISCYMIDL